TWGVLTFAALALILGAIYQADSPTPDNPVVGALADATATTAAGGRVVDGGGAVGQTATTAPSTNPVEAFLPRSGQASACQEPVGVDLKPGWAATIEINGIPIPDDQLNVTTDENGQQVPGDRSASRALGQYTFGPESDCPNGRVLRPTGNVLKACIFRVEEGPASCVIKESTFDVL
ncbi:MAG: hypothetical protein OEW29_08800, partial [Acidimicrobiia bacterium]|nr:hypothetical protein [Acidimicrobiia bacterium]